MGESIPLSPTTGSEPSTFSSKGNLLTWDSSSFRGFEKNPTLAYYCSWVRWLISNMLLEEAKPHDVPGCHTVARQNPSKATRKHLLRSLQSCRKLLLPLPSCTNLISSLPLCQLGRATFFFLFLFPTVSFSLSLLFFFFSFFFPPVKEATLQGCHLFTFWTPNLLKCASLDEATQSKRTETGRLHGERKAFCWDFVELETLMMDAYAMAGNSFTSIQTSSRRIYAAQGTERRMEGKTSPAHKDIRRARR